MKHRLNKKTWLVLAALTLVCTVTVGGTLAYLLDKTDAVTNTFTPSTVTVTVDDTVTGAVKQDVQITVGNNVESYVRAAIVGNWCDEEDTIVAPWSADDQTAGTFADLAGGKWVEYGDYYYYTEPVPANTAVPVPLFTSYTVHEKPAVADHLRMTIVAQAVQSVPAAAVGELWGVSISSGSVTGTSAQ